MATEVLYEIGVEEIPAGMVLPALEQMEAGLRQGLADLRLDHGEIHTYGTPRRLAIVAEDVQEQQAEAIREVKGPPAAQAFNEQGRPTPAAQGFARGKGISVQDLEVRSTNKGEFVFAVVHEPGRQLTEILPQLLQQITWDLSFPKTMRWGAGELRFARPLRWLVALAGDQVLKMEIAGLRASNLSNGHRVLSSGEVLVAQPSAYLETLREAGVIADHRERQRLIVEGAQQCAAQCGGQVVTDEEVLTEINFLVEHPRCLVGSFDPAYLRLPREVIITVMQGHQRYFPVSSQLGELLPYFVMVSNVGPEADEAVLAGNERVLRPRLEDARFYLEEDMKKPLTERLSDLAQVTFMDGLGTLCDKTERLVKLVDWLAHHLPEVTEADRQAALRAAELSKCDLTTMMISDTKLGELQGIIGGHYARLSGEPEAVAQAIASHYQPVGPEDEPPASAAGALLSLADKADNLAAAFRLGLEPTGSADPQALRRQAVALIRLMRDRNYVVPWEELFDQVLGLLPEPPAEAQTIPVPEAKQRLRAFFAQRLEALWGQEGVSYDLARAVLGVPWTDLVEVSQRARFFADLRREERATFDQLVTVAERPARIRRPEGVAPEAPVDTGRFEYELEKQVWQLSGEISAQVNRALGQQPPEYATAVSALLRLAAPIHELFEEVMIMVDDDQLRSNRLALMAQIDGMFLRLADFLQVVRDG